MDQIQSDNPSNWLKKNAPLAFVWKLIGTKYFKVGGDFIPGASVFGYGKGTVKADNQKHVLQPTKCVGMPSKMEKSALTLIYYMPLITQ
ncbi:hypothetical protein Syun_002212 [Stephania yunnanensis]|uniref:Uncharacterized protein n=1 Tax=Stephania yunnanensis TaxID=152371 RepID=A0AAP0LH53_9MAGN